MKFLDPRCSLLSTLLLVALSASQSNGVSAEPITYSEQVAPIFFEHCAMCHRPDQVAPMSLLSYQEARPWAKSIAKAVQTGLMPPWSGNSDHRKWSNDISLTSEQIETIVAWVDQGARQGKPEDLPEVPSFPDVWTLGEPDYIITLDEAAIPADGDDVFPQQTVTIDLEEEQWVQAIEFLPSDRRVAHHFQATYNLFTDNDRNIGELNPTTTTGILGIWTAGMPPYVFPEGVGRVLGKKARILVDSHYHPFGEPTTDQTRIGLYFGKGELKKEVATIVATNTGLRIPPNAPNHAEYAYYEFDRGMQILAFSPHLHVRGKAMRYDLTYPDGRVENLLDVPKYNFNWQWLYYPTEPIDVPAGSTMKVTGVWDNSSDNPANPDPSKEIIYRGNTFDEMFVGFFEAVPKEGIYHQPASATDRITQLLSKHPSEDSYLFGGFLPFGIYVPKEGEGWLYLAQGVNMFSISLDDFQWDGNHLAVTAQLPTPEASATTTTIVGDLDDQGRLKGTFHYGLDSPAPLKMPAMGQPMTAIQAKAGASGR